MKILVSVYDHKAETFSTIVTADNAAVACRMFRTLVRSGDNQYAQNPEDFALFSLAEYHEPSGQITPHEKPFLLMTAKAAGDDNV